MDLIFASNNKGKITEIQSLVPDTISVISLQQAGIDADIPEPYHTFRENAWAKAQYIFTTTGTSCFAEDSGLVVPALDGAPGVYSARYAGEPSNDAANNAKLLDAIQSLGTTPAYYQAIICLILDSAAYYFEGTCMGTITTEPKGTGGFGYDPLFIPDGYHQTFGELAPEIKNKISHRAAAVRSLLAFLNKPDLK